MNNDKECSRASEQSLHHFAATNSEAKRLNDIEDDPLRSPYARDRDRILFSRCFRRLAYKTQLYLTSQGNQHLRTRLTHTLEVTNLARVIARNLRLNEDLVEAIAYGHDVGHAPFGHAGEQELNSFLNGEHLPPARILALFKNPPPKRLPIDFRHNFQSVRLLALLETYEFAGEGLNLTLQTLEGVLKHTGLTNLRRRERCSYPDADLLLAELCVSPYPVTLEAQVVAVADEIAQVAHDLGDAIAAETLKPSELFELPVVARMLNVVGAKGKALRETLQGSASRAPGMPTVAGQVVSVIVSYFVRHCIDGAMAVLRVATARPAALWPECKPVPLDDFSELAAFKDNLIVNSFDVNRMDNKGRYIIRRLIDAYLSDPRQLPDAALLRYGKAKEREHRRVGHDEVRQWFHTKRDAHELVVLSTSEMETVLKATIQAAGQGAALRRLPFDLLQKLIPYLVLDLDYVRGVADHIALMTDSYAEIEMQRLYGTGAPVLV